MKVDSGGRIVVTLPMRGTLKFGLAFANEHLDWLRERQVEALKAQNGKIVTRFGQSILFRGEWHELKLEKDCGRPVLSFASERVFIADESMDLRRPLSVYLTGIAKREFPERTRELACRHGLSINRVTVRGQKTRWGSCSSSGSISLNWRLVQAPRSVRDYVILHELMHLIEMNHSQRFWDLVAKACPDYRQCKDWLDINQSDMNW